MTSIRVATTIARLPKDVWEAVADVTTHVDWMADAEEVRITSDRREGAGTTFDCLTKVGPIRLTDRMQITEWKPPATSDLPDRDVGEVGGEVMGVGVMGVRHRGIVTGEGRFTVAPKGAGTEFCWEEDLRFPLWLGGGLAAWVSRPVLSRIWRGNLRRLRTQLEQH